MSSNQNGARKFKIEGSGRMLDALANAIVRALRAARSSPTRTGTGRAIRGGGIIDVEVTNSDPDEVKYVITSVNDAIRVAAGWAEPKLCEDCDEPVALLFYDAYLETSEGEGVICCRCYRLREGDEP